MTTHPSYPDGQCTRYAADTWGPPVGDYWGDARMWLGAAIDAGYRVAADPSVGALVVWGANAGGTGAAGHVAIVTALSPLTVRESNWNQSLRVDTRVVDAGSQSGINGYVPLPDLGGDPLTPADRGDLASAQVQTLYATVLHRNADDDVAGRDFWYGQIMAHGFGATTRAFLVNPESRTDIAAEAAPEGAPPNA